LIWKALPMAVQTAIFGKRSESMREIIFDTETTGLDAREDRVIELGCIEMVNRFPTGRTFHHYINPQGRAINVDAQAVHGISAEHLVGKPGFAEIAEEFLAFIDGAKLVAHNAGFDMGFINAEFARLGHPAVGQEWVVDTLALARRKHPMGPNSLDALCRRYGIDNAHRTKHGALLDSELLAEVYIELVGGKQAALILDTASAAGQNGDAVEAVHITVIARPTPLPPRLSEAERAAHAAMVETLGEKALWRTFSTE
jgi:DNA polymerase-3 subunit epsilon